MRKFWNWLNTVGGLALVVFLVAIITLCIPAPAASGDPPSEQYVQLTITFGGDEAWYMADETGEVEVWTFREGETVSFWFNTGNSGWVRLSGDKPLSKTRVVVGAANG